jgi:hypothetical protein
MGKAAQEGFPGGPAFFTPADAVTSLHQVETHQCQELNEDEAFQSPDLLEKQRPQTNGRLPLMV